MSNMADLPSAAPWWLIALAAVLGAVAGSWAATLAARAPTNAPSMAPSTCPACGHRLSLLEQVPVLAWLALRRRCLHCSAPITGRYVTFEVTTAAVFAALTWATGPGWHLGALCYLAWLTLTLTSIDWDLHRLPNQIVLPGYALSAAALALACASDPTSLVRAVAGALVLSVGYGIVMLIWPPGMGFGDVKLAVIVGAYLAALSWPALAVGTMAAFAFGAAGALATLATPRGAEGRRTGIAFGPAMLAGVWVALLYSDDLWAAYMNLLT